MIEDPNNPAIARAGVGAEQELLLDFAAEIDPDFALLDTLWSASAQARNLKFVGLHWHPSARINTRNRERVLCARPGPGGKEAEQKRYCEFCQLIRIHPQSVVACESWGNEVESIVYRTRKPFISECHAGLTGIGVPVISGGQYIATLLFGQVLCKPQSKKRFQEIKSKFSTQLGKKLDRLERAYMRLHVLSEDQLARTIDSMDVISLYVARLFERTKKLVDQHRSLERLRLLQKRDFLERLISGQPLRSQELVEVLGADPEPNIALVLKVDNIDELHARESMARRDMAFESLFLRYLRHFEADKATLVGWVKFGEIIFLTSVTPRRNSALESILAKELGAEILSYLERETEYRGSVGIGVRAENVLDLRESYHEALTALQARFSTQGSQKVFHINDRNSAAFKSRESFSQALDELANAIANGQGGRVQESFEHLTTFVDKLCPEPSLTRRLPLFMDIVGTSCQAAIQAGARRDRVLALKSACIDGVLSAENVTQAEEHLAQHLREVFSSAREAWLGKKEKLVAEACQFVMSKYPDWLSREQVAAHLGVSIGYLSRAFHEVKGVTLREFSTNFRLQHAKKLLLSPHSSVADVSSKVGFESVTHFCTIFKRRFGVTPGVFQRNPAYSESLREPLGEMFSEAAESLSTIRTSE